MFFKFSKKKNIGLLHISVLEHISIPKQGSPHLRLKDLKQLDMDSESWEELAIVIDGRLWRRELSRGFARGEARAPAADLRNDLPFSLSVISDDGHFTEALKTHYFHCRFGQQ